MCSFEPYSLSDAVLGVPTETPFSFKNYLCFLVLDLLGIRQNQAISGTFRQDQAKSGTNRLLEPRVHFLNSGLRAAHFRYPCHKVRSISRAKKVLSPYDNGFRRTLALAVRSFWVTLLPTALGLSLTGWQTHTHTLSLFSL